jgi:hypothetical protein
VTAELGRIAAAPEEAASDRGRVDIAESGHALRLRLCRGSCGTWDERVIETNEDCGERAIAAAVVIASWQTDLRSQVKLDLDSSTAVWFPSAGLFGIGTASSIDSWAGGAGLDFQVTHRTGWGGRLAAWGTTYRSLTLGTGSGAASWTWWGLGVGPVYQLGRGRLLLAGSAQLVLAGLVVRGENLVNPQQDLTMDLGARLGVDVGLRWGPIAPCVGVAMLAWPRSHRIKALGIDAERTLSKLDVLLALGFRWGQGP